MVVGAPGPDSDELAPPSSQSPIRSSQFASPTRTAVAVEFDDIGAQDRGQHALTAADQWPGEGPHAREVVNDARLVAQHHGVMAGLHLKQHARADLHLQPIGRAEQQPAGHDHADMVVLAGIRQRHRLQVIRLPKARIEHRPHHGVDKLPLGPAMGNGRIRMALITFAALAIAPTSMGVSPTADAQAVQKHDDCTGRSGKDQTDCQQACIDVRRKTG